MSPAPATSPTAPTPRATSPPYPKTTLFAAALGVVVVAVAAGAFEVAGVVAEAWVVGITEPEVLAETEAEPEGVNPPEVAEPVGVMPATESYLNVKKDYLIM